MDFTETTAAETGFAKIWDQMVKPDLAPHWQLYKRYKIFAYIANGLLSCVAIGVAIVLELWTNYQENSLSAWGIFIASCAALLGLAHLCHRPAANLKKTSIRRLHQALNAFFSDWITPVDDLRPIKKYGKYLKAQKLTTYGGVTISSAYDSTITDVSTPEYRFYNCTYESIFSGDENSSRIIDYLVVHIRLKDAVPSKVKIMVNRGLGGIFARWLSAAQPIRFENGEFMKWHEVYAKDIKLAERLITPNFQQALINMRQYFSAGPSWFETKSNISCLFEEDEVIICFSDLADILSLQKAGGDPAQMVNAAHNAISQLAQVNYIVTQIQTAVPHLVKMVSRQDERKK